MMSAVVLAAGGQLEVTERPMPALERSDDVLIRVKAVGICGSDLHALADPPGHPSRPGVVFGHEFSGVVAEVGESVTGLRIGDRVAVDPNPGCGRCDECRSAQPNACSTLLSNPYVDYRWPNTPGFFRDGGLAEFCVLPEHYFHRAASDADPVELAMAEPLACALNVIEKVEPKPLDTAVVLGGGPIGLLAVMLLARFGVRRIALVEPSEARRSLGMRIGATETYSTMPGEHPDRSFSIVIDAVGVLFDEAIGLAEFGGRIGLIGLNTARRQAVDAARISLHEITVRGAFLTRFTMVQAVRLIEAGQLPLRDLVTHRLPLSRIGEALDLIRDGRAVKVIVEP